MKRNRPRFKVYENNNTVTLKQELSSGGGLFTLEIDKHTGETTLYSTGFYDKTLHLCDWTIIALGLEHKGKIK